MAQNRNSRWRPSAMDFSKFDFWPMGLVRRLIFHLDTKFGPKMLIDAEIMAKNLNSRWRPSAILEFLYHHSPYRTTHEVFSLGYISVSNFVLIRYIVLKIWGFDFCRIGLKCLFTPKNFGFWGSGLLKIIDNRWDPQKAHMHLKPGIMSINAFNSVHICDL